MSGVTIEQLEQFLEWLKVERYIPDQWALRELVERDLKKLRETAQPSVHRGTTSRRHPDQSDESKTRR